MRCELHVESQVELLSDSVWLRISHTKLLLKVKLLSCRLTGSFVSLARDRFGKFIVD